MKKNCFLVVFCGLILLSGFSGCSFSRNFSDTSLSVLKNTEISDTSTVPLTDTIEPKDIRSSSVPADPFEASTSDTETEKESETNSESSAALGDSDDASFSGDMSAENAEKSAETPEILTTEGYVMSVDGNTMYVDLENTGGRTYPGEGEDRKVAFDISSAEQIQTNISDVYPATNHLIRSGIHVDIEYYVQNGLNIATKLTSDSVEHGLVIHLSEGKVTEISDSSITINVTDLENTGETLEFDLSDCDDVSENISTGSIVSVTYYIKQKINYAVGIVAVDWTS